MQVTWPGLIWTRIGPPPLLASIHYAAEFVSVHDRDSGTLEDAPPPPRVLAPPPSPKPRKSRSRRRGGSSSVEVTQRLGPRLAEDWPVSGLVPRIYDPQ